MKIVYKFALALLLVGITVGSAIAKIGKPANAYLSSAKIAIVESERDPEMLPLAQSMLDSLLIYHGPHSEAYYWYSQIGWDLSNAQADLKEKLPFVKKAIIYADSLKWTCDNKDIKKKNRKKCAKFDEQMDSILVDQWRHYYNEGVKQISEVEELMETVKVETDSASLVFYQTRLDALIDSCQDNMGLAIVIDSTDGKPYIGLASVNEKVDNFKAAIVFLKKALPISDNRTQLLVEVAYDYIRDDDYCGAIPWFQEYVDSMVVDEAVMQDIKKQADVISTAHNLASCYNNCKEFDNGYVTFQRILEIDPTNIKALLGASRYHQHVGRKASDSARVYRDKEDEAGTKIWNDARNVRFDSSIVYLAQGFEVNQDDADLAAEYGLMLAIRERYADARLAFARAAELDPAEVDYWTSLGDCCLSLHEWQCAADAYEKVVELKPENKAVLEHLADLHQQLGNETRRAEINKKLKSM